MSSKKHLFLIDGSSYIYRAFYALPFLSNSRGIPTSAVYGFARMINGLLKEHKPTHMAVVFDVSRETFRTERFKDYKAHRPKMPDELSIQIPYIKRLLEALRIPTLELRGFEADDVIGTISRLAEESSWRVTIVSPDKDLLQLVSHKVSLLDPMKEVLYTPAKVVERFGVEPALIPTYLALVGDKSDNIPGVKGVGPKKAKELINSFGDLESIYKRLDAVSPSLRKRLESDRELAFLSLELSSIKRDLPLTFQPEDFELREPDVEALRELYSTLEFSSLMKELPKEQKKQQKTKYRMARSLKEVSDYIKGCKELSVDLETTPLDPVEASIVGISLSRKTGEALYIPVGHEGANNLPLSEVLDTLKGALKSGAVLKVGQNLKYDITVLLGHGVSLSPIFDTMVASYLINPLKKRHSLDELALEYLGYRTVSYKEATSHLLDTMNFSHLSPEEALFYACEDADIALRLKGVLERRLKEEELHELFHKIEMPLVPVLARMERRGVKIDREKLLLLGREIEEKMAQLEAEIYRLAGEKFNINSPKQLSLVLFGKLGLKPKKRTKTGYSTNIEVLEALSLEHPLPAKVLEYRQLAKLKSTYIDGLIKQINRKTGRVHTSYNQTATATGRLSSQNPNLQNIPIRSDLGKLIRDAFVAEEGYFLVAADYSQIELRILASMANDPNLKEAFKRGEDIHTATACRIFGVKPEEVTPNMRREAKVVNFGIIYGMSPYGLSKELKIPVKEAQDYIDRYFAQYPEVVRFIERTIQEAKERGYVKTLFGRKRPVPELFSPKKDEREQGKRIAINTPIQGTAADVIKLAMVKAQRYIDESGVDAHMILQVHDELVFEVKQEDAESFAEAIKEVMEQAAPEIDVPLKVDVKVGKTWGEC